MELSLDNWKVQVKKGYLELCLLLLIRRHKRMYGLELLESLADMDLAVKEGTLYPLLSRLTDEGLLHSNWEMQNLKGHPRKFYALTKKGVQALSGMEAEFTKMVSRVAEIKKMGVS